MNSFNVAQLLNTPKLPELLELIDQELNKVISTDHEIIKVPASRLVKAKSKRLRPSLLLAIVDGSGAKLNKQVISSAVAIELVHIASLVHDDIIDHADIRWGVPTINSKEGVEHAVMMGDYLFSKANQQATKVNAEVASIIAKSIEELSVGEMLELNDAHNSARTIESLVHTIEGKTASVMSASCQIGAICSDLNAEDVEALTQFGKLFGMSFQFIDDLLDFLSNDKILGKPTGNDVKEGIYNSPIIISLNYPKGESIKKLLNKETNSNNSELVDLLIANDSIKQSIMLINEYNKLAKLTIDNLADENVKRRLIELPDLYTSWVLDNLIDPKYKKFIASL
jgi:geranylgeranyl pyrophosphate synthase